MKLKLNIDLYYLLVTVDRRPFLVAFNSESLNKLLDTKGNMHF
jgi:hypothetical protein